MPYNNNWYDQYRKQLEETNVRITHNQMFQYFFQLGGFYEETVNIIDLGCATLEMYKYGYPNKYFGIDLNLQEPGHEDKVRLDNYLQIHPLYKICPFQPNAFCSLFSSEIIMPPWERYIFYNKVFQENPSIQAGLVAGFYYEDKKLHNHTSENGFDTVYQTIEDQREYISDLFTEFRTYVNVPSNMFGNDLVEVWKIFLRK